MKIVLPSFKIRGAVDGEKILMSIEEAGRTCYKSESRITSTSSAKFVANLIKSGHESVLEHESISVNIICDRGVSHELVRHRIASYSQESIRYCNYMTDKFADDLTFIKPCFWQENSEKYKIWKSGMMIAEDTYSMLIRDGATPQEARAVLPNSIKTEVVCTMNLRAWRNFFNLRALGTMGKPHPQMKEIALPMLYEFHKQVPVVFDDLIEKINLLT